MKETRGHSVSRAASAVALGVLGSRVLGLLRDMIFASWFPDRALRDAYLAAFRIPNLLRELFAEGALSSAFVPVFTEEHEKAGTQAAWRLASTVINLLVMVVGAIVIAGMVWAPFIVRMIAPGFSAHPGKVEATITMTRIMFPFLLMVTLAAVAMGILNTMGRFLVPAAASCWFNVGTMVVGLLAGFLLGRGEPEKMIYGWAIGTMAGGILQFLSQLPLLLRLGFRWSPVFSYRSPPLRKMARLMGPAIIGGSASQVNSFVNQVFASWLVNGAVTWLYLAFRLMQLPIGLFGVALGVATLPTISRHAARQEWDAFRRRVATSLRLALMLCVPAAVGLFLLSEPIIALVFGWWNYGPDDVNRTAAALGMYSLGLVAYAGIKILAPAFYALGQPRFPMVVSFFSIAVNLVGNWFFVFRFGGWEKGWEHQGLALTTSLVACTNCGLLLWGLRKKLGHLHAREIMQTLGNVMIASVLMGFACWYVWRVGTGWWGTDGVTVRVLNVMVPVLTSVLVYLAAIALMRERVLIEALRSRGDGRKA